MSAKDIEDINVSDMFNQQPSIMPTLDQLLQVNLF